MKNKTLKITTILLTNILTILSIIIVTIKNTNSNYNLLILLPIVFLICSNLYLFKFLFKKFSFFRISFCAVTFLRYVALPALMVLTGQYRSVSAAYIPNSHQLLVATLLVVYELIVYTIVIFFADRKISKNEEKKEIIFSNKIQIFLIFIIISLGLLVLHPYILNYFSFITPKNNTLLTAAEITGGSVIGEISIIMLIVSKNILFLVFLRFFSKKYKKTHNRFYCFLALIVTLINACIYYGISMSQFLFSVLVSFYVFIKVFPNFKKIVYSLCILIIVIVLPVMNVARNRYDFYSKETGLNKTMLESVNKIEGYFGGVNNVAIGIETKNEYSKNSNIQNLVFDFIRPIVGVNLLVKNMNIEYSNVYFNYTYFQANMLSVIFPTVAQGYFYFGAIFAPLLGVILLLFGLKLESIAERKNRVEYIYFLSLALCRLGTLMGANINLQINELSMQIMIPVLLIILNDRFKLKGD